MCMPMLCAYERWFKFIEFCTHWDSGKQSEEIKIEYYEHACAVCLYASKRDSECVILQNECMRMWVHQPKSNCTDVPYPRNFICCNKISTNISLCFNIIIIICVSVRVSPRRTRFDKNKRQWMRLLNGFYVTINYVWHKKLHENEMNFSGLKENL